jgi:hypothetical protein
MRQAGGIAVGMEAFAGAAIGLLVLISLAVGLRLIALRLRGGGSPELLLGLMLLLTVCIGYPGLIAVERASSDWARPLYVVANLCVNAGFAMLYVFTWRVFRADSGWARSFAGLGVLALLANLLARVVDAVTRPELRPPSEMVAQSLIQTSLVVVPYAWTAWESIRYYERMRRRVRLDLADPVVCNRFLLWGLTSVFVIAGVALNSIALALRVNVFETPSILFASSATGLAQAVLLLLAFLPPRSYLEWVRSRAHHAPA